jgi:hypothetical protein
MSATPISTERRRPTLSARTPVGISNRMVLAVKEALTTNTSSTLRSASRKKRTHTSHTRATANV